MTKSFFGDADYSDCCPLPRPHNKFLMANCKSPISKFTLDVGHSHLEIGYWSLYIGHSSFPLPRPHLKANIELRTPNVEVAFALASFTSTFPGRAGSCLPAPPQSRTSGFPASGSSVSWFRYVYIEYTTRGGGNEKYSQIRLNRSHDMSPLRCLRFSQNLHDRLTWLKYRLSCS